MMLDIAKDFSPTPGGRYRAEGPHSGEKFRDTLLTPKFLEAEKHGKRLLIRLDHLAGYPTSFLDESFGGLAQKFTIKRVLSVLRFEAEKPYLIQDIHRYIEKRGRAG